MRRSRRATCKTTRCIHDEPMTPKLSPTRALAAVDSFSCIIDERRGRLREDGETSRSVAFVACVAVGADVDGRATQHQIEDYIFAKRPRVSRVSKSRVIRSLGALADAPCRTHCMAAYIVCVHRLHARL